MRRISLTTALHDGKTPRQARVIAEAAMLADAARHADSPDGAPLGTSSGCRLRTLDGLGTRGLVELAQELGQSPVVAAARQGSVAASRE